MCHCNSLHVCYTVQWSLLLQTQFRQWATLPTFTTTNLGDNLGRPLLVLVGFYVWAKLKIHGYLFQRASVSD